MLNNGMVEVRYIDYGNTECSSKDTLKQISDELMTLPPQAVLCGLEGLYPPVEGDQSCHRYVPALHTKSE